MIIVMSRIKTQPIGVFDSGIGGLTAVKELIKLLPEEDIVYFGDTARVPYGSRDSDTIVNFAKQDLKFLLSKKVKAVLIACGTASSTSLHILKQMTDIPVVGVIEPAAEAAVKATKNNKIAVLATQASISSHAYFKAIKQLIADNGQKYEILEKACHLFVPLVENGFTDKAHPIVKAVMDEYLKEIRSFGADTIILGCTHYPLLKDAIQAYLPETAIIESGKEAARYIADMLPADLRNSSGGKREYYVSEATSTFKEACSIFVGERISQNPIVVNIENI